LAFRSSYQMLSAPAARMFRLLGMAPGPDTSTAAAASLIGSPGDEADALLAELTDLHLLAEPLPSRYAMHDLLRAFAIEQLDTEDHRCAYRRDPAAAGVVLPDS